MITIITLFAQYIGSLDISLVAVSTEQTYSQPGDTGSFLRETVSQLYRYSPHRLSLLDRTQSETMQNHFEHFAYWGILCFYCRLLLFFRINVFKTFFQEHYQSVKWFGSRLRLTFCRSSSGFKPFAKVNSRQHK